MHLLNLETINNNYIFSLFLIDHKKAKNTTYKIKRPSSDSAIAKCKTCGFVIEFSGQKTENKLKSKKGEVR